MEKRKRKGIMSLLDILQNAQTPFESGIRILYVRLENSILTRGVTKEFERHGGGWGVVGRGVEKLIELIEG